jgi:4-hydroxy-2-oxoheptanedioate aldolase
LETKGKSTKGIFMKQNILKQKLARNEIAIGVMSPYVDPAIAETIGLIGMDFYIVDGEHGPIDPNIALGLVRGCESVNITPLARVRSIDPKLILQFLDAGIMGVMIPSVTTTDEVKCLVEAVKYPPIGNRGCGPMRAADYMIGHISQSEYVAYANEQTLVLPVIEDIQAMVNLEKMVKVPGVDGWIIGPRDLAMSMGFYDGPNHTEVQNEIDRIMEIVNGANLFVGISAATGGQAKFAIENGARFLITTISTLLKSSASAYMRTMAEKSSNA